MISIVGVFAAGLLGVGIWLARRSRVGPPVPALPLNSPSEPMREPDAVTQAKPAATDAGTLLQTANDSVTQRLWKLAFSAPSQAQMSDRLHARVRDNIMALLEVDSLKSDFFPRRPVLLSQLLQAVNDPDAAAEELSRIVAHDPVLTGEVLRLANSSLYRASSTPIETIPRAIVICGIDALRGMLAVVMLRPAFRATRKNFPRFPRVLWERTERATRAAELYAQATHPEDRFEAQLVVLLGALGPLVIYGVTLDVYARNPHLVPSSAVCVELISTYAPRMALRVARDWQTSARLLAALQRSPSEPLTHALAAGELFGTLAFLESQTALSSEERLECLRSAGVTDELASRIWPYVSGRG